MPAVCAVRGPTKRNVKKERNEKQSQTAVREKTKERALDWQSGDEWGLNESVRLTGKERKDSEWLAIATNTSTRLAVGESVER